MVDDKVERTTEVKEKPPIETTSTVITSPDHPEYTADRAVAKDWAQGRCAIIAAIDGVGSGAEESGQAARIVQDKLQGLETSFIVPPTINQAVETLGREIYNAGVKIQNLQKIHDNDQVDTTVSAAVVCESRDGKRRFLVTANVGDSRIYRYTPNTGKAEQLTRDHSLVQSLVEAGQISQEEAFVHPLRNQIYRTVGSLNSPDDVDFTVDEIRDGDVFIATSDGVSDNLTSEGLLIALQGEFRESYESKQGRINLKKFTKGVAQRARNVMSTSSEHAKNDDITVSALKILPRIK
jgi:serine/threonine protein phosphatase PrpC